VHWRQAAVLLAVLAVPGVVLGFVYLRDTSDASGLYDADATGACLALHTRAYERPNTTPPTLWIKPQLETIYDPSAPADAVIDVTHLGGGVSRGRAWLYFSPREQGARTRYKAFYRYYARTGGRRPLYTAAEVKASVLLRRNVVIKGNGPIRSRFAAVLTGCLMPQQSALIRARG
jgi:hypothetical protein